MKKQFLRDAAIYNGLITLIVGGSLFQNPEIWINDYPPDIKEKFGPRSPEASKWARFWAIPLFMVAIGYVVKAGLRLKKANNGRLPFSQAFKYVYLLFLSFWTFDLVVLDWLFFTTIQPEFIILPGTEGMAGYKDYAFHLTASWPFVFILAGPSALIAWLISR